MILAPDKNLTLSLLRETVHLKIKEHNEKRGYLPLLLFIVNPSFITIILISSRFYEGREERKRNYYTNWNWKKSGEEIDTSTYIQSMKIR